MEQKFHRVGLTAQEAARRLQQDGPNELSLEKTRGLLKICAEVVTEPMFMLLLAAGGIYLLMGDVHDALVLVGFVVIIIGVTIAQEQRTERALEALRDLSSPRALVLREGVETRIAGREVVVGDVLLLAEGDRVPADARVLEFHELSADESMLTGESVSVPKLSMEALVYAGTMIVRGQGMAEVIATGKTTRLGSIGKALEEIDPEASPLHQQVKQLTLRIAVIALVLCVGLALLYVLQTGDWLEGVLSGITLAMAALPQEFPVIMIVFFALGARRIAQHRVLTRNLNAVETLGKTTVLCVDKTGTLTENRMKVASLTIDGHTLATDGLSALPAAYNELVRFIVLASEIEPHDPMEHAFHDFARQHLHDALRPYQDWRLAREYELSAELMAMTHAWAEAQRAHYVVAAKGAPEAIVALCHLPDAQRRLVEAEAMALAAQGLRVLAVAKATYPLTQDWPSNQHDFDFEYLGLVGLEDPVRPDVPAAVAACQRAGIRVVMITGDHPVTADAIARKVDIAPNDVHARITPERKLAIVTQFKQAGEIVAMTGDGVNDAPALKAAHIGIAMGKRGTDVAREAADLVLLDDAFASIVDAVRLGRRIYDNIRKAMVFILAVHVPIAGLSMIPVFFPSWPLLLLPIHIVFLELIIDPACSLIFEAERAEADIMERPPRRRDQRLFAQPAIAVALLQGASALAVCLAIFVFRRPDHGAEAARALTFAALVVALLAIILINRSWSRSALAMLGERNPALWWVVSGALAVLAVAFFVAPVRALFSFAPLHLPDIGWSLLAGLVCLGWFELLKRTPWWRALQGRRQRPG